VEGRRGRAGGRVSQEWGSVEKDMARDGLHFARALRRRVLVCADTDARVG
jgi:hypothetical protein